jgi:Mitochondrial carrier protein
MRVGVLSQMRGRFIVKEVYESDKGMRGFYRGFTPCLLRSFPTNGAAILMYETVSRTGTRWLLE